MPAFTSVTFQSGVLFTLLLVTLTPDPSMAQDREDRDLMDIDPLERVVRSIEAMRAIQPDPPRDESPYDDRSGFRDLEFPDYEKAEQEVEAMAPDSDEDLYELISGAYEQWWHGTQKNYPGMAQTVMAWEGTSSWGNFGMQAMGTVPRSRFDPVEYASYINLIYTPWLNLYDAIDRSERVLKAIDEGEIIFDSSFNDITDKSEAVAYFVKGISYGFLAKNYERGFIYEVGDYHFEEVEFVDYTELKDVAVDALDQALTSDFDGTIRTRWIPLMGDSELDFDKFKRLVNTHKLRLLMHTARSADEFDVDWQQIIELSNEGLQEDFLINEFVSSFWSRYSSRGAITQDQLWMRASYKTIGRYDQSGQYDEWLDSPWQDREEFTLDTPDARVAGQDPDGEGEPGSTQEGKYFRYAGGSLFDPARGTYFMSEYQHIRWEDSYQQTDVPEQHHILSTELDLYRAEAKLRTGENVDEAIDIINQTRVDNGELPPATNDATVDSLLEMLDYERGIELMHTSAGLRYFDKRRQGTLTEGTAKDFRPALVAPPVLVSPAHGSVHNPTDISLEVSYEEMDFFYSPDAFRVTVASDPDFANIIFEGENAAGDVFELTDLQENHIYYVKIQSIDYDNDYYSPEVDYAFSTRLETLTVEEINDHYDETGEDFEFVRIEGVVVSRPFNHDGNRSLYIDDGTGGALINLDMPEEKMHSIQPGSVLDVGGEIDRDLGRGDLAIVSTEFRNVGEDDVPHPISVSAEELGENMSETSNRRVVISDVSRAGEWPDEVPSEFITSENVTMVENETGEEFQLTIPPESDLYATDPPVEGMDLVGIDSGVYPGRSGSDIISIDVDGESHFLDDVEPVRPEDNSVVESVKPELMWEEGEYAENYDIVIYDNEDPSRVVQYHDGTKSTWIRPDSLEHDKTYSWKVRGVVEGTSGNYSASRSFTTPRDTQRPTDLVIEETEEGLNLSWEIIDDSGLESFRIFRGESLADLSEYETISSENREFIDEDLADGTSFYAVAGVDEAGLETDLSNIVSYFNTSRQISEDWEMVSLPVSDADVHLQHSQAFHFDYTYQSDSTLVANRGYWIRSDEQETLESRGEGVESAVLSLREGWNLIGSLVDRVEVSSIADPSEILTDTPVYVFNGGYETTESILPGEGHWIYADEAGDIEMDIHDEAAEGADDRLLAAEADIEEGVEEEDESGEKGPAEIRISAEQGEQSFFVSDAKLEKEDKQKYLMPPMAPDPVLDVRNSDGYRVMDQESVELNINAQAYPLRIELHGEDPPGTAFQLVARRDQTQDLFNLHEDGEILIHEEYDSYKLQKVDADEVAEEVDETKIEPNYPNPFNASTHIDYQLAEQTRVRIEVYNALGQRVATLVDEEKSNGRYSVEFNPGGLAAGVYVLRFQTSHNEDVQKMTIIN